MQEFLEHTLRNYRASSLIRSPPNKTPNHYVAVFWKFVEPPLNHQLVRGQHPLFDSLKENKHYQGKYIKTNPDRDFAMLFLVDERNLPYFFIQVKGIFEMYSSDVETHGYKFANSKKSFSRFGTLM
jgi:hypothetical protein